MINFFYRIMNTIPGAVPVRQEPAVFEVCHDL